MCNRYKGISEYVIRELHPQPSPARARGGWRMADDPTTVDSAIVWLFHPLKNQKVININV